MLRSKAIKCYIIGQVLPYMLNWAVFRYIHAVTLIIALNFQYRCEFTQKVITAKMFIKTVLVNKYLEDYKSVKIKLYLNSILFNLRFSLM